MSFKILNRERIAVQVYESFQKGRAAAPIGTISNGYKKVAQDKWVEVPKQDYPLKVKEGVDGEFKTFSFTRGEEKVGTVFLRLKRGWNQLHITVDAKHQGKGLGAQLISSVVDKAGYVSVPDGRIVNENFTKVLNKLDKSKYEVKRTKFDETIVYKKGASVPEIFKNDLI